MTRDTDRPSGVPGLTITGCASYRYYLVWTHPETGRRLPVLAPRLPSYGNDFRTVRDARAAALRLAPLLAWDTPAPARLSGLTGLARTMALNEIRAALQGRRRLDLGPDAL